MRPDLEAVQQAIEDDRDGFEHRVASRIETTMRQGVQEWQKTNPNHDVKFFDVMGTYGFTVDGEWLDEILRRSLPVYSFRRMDDVLAPLMELGEWYCDVSDLTGVSVEFEIPALKKD